MPEFLKTCGLLIGFFKGRLQHAEARRVLVHESRTHVPIDFGHRAPQRINKRKAAKVVARAISSLRVCMPLVNATAVPADTKLKLPRLLVEDSYLC